MFRMASDYRCMEVLYRPETQDFIRREAKCDVYADMVMEKCVRYFDNSDHDFNKNYFIEKLDVDDIESLEKFLDSNPNEYKVEQYVRSIIKTTCTFVILNASRKKIQYIVNENERQAGFAGFDVERDSRMSTYSAEENFFTTSDEEDAKISRENKFNSMPEFIKNGREQIPLKKIVTMLMQGKKSAEIAEAIGRSNSQFEFDMKVIMKMLPMVMSKVEASIA